MKRDIELNYIEAGNENEKVLILLHGNEESAARFSKQIREFSKAFHVYALDTRGHGDSPRGIRPFTLNQFSKDLKDFIALKNIEKPNLLGFSDGANIALLYALKHPDKVEKLILNGGNLFPEGADPEMTEDFQRRYDLLKKEKPSRENKREMELLSLMLNEPHIAPESLQNLDFPVLVLAGTNDCILPEHTRLIAESLPRSELCFLPGDHFIAYKNPASFNKKVLEFLQK